MPDFIQRVRLLGGPFHDVSFSEFFPGDRITLPANSPFQQDLNFEQMLLWQLYIDKVGPDGWDIAVYEIERRCWFKAWRYVYEGTHPVTVDLLGRYRVFTDAELAARQAKAELLPYQPKWG